jgi:hypothetical protein
MLFVEVLLILTSSCLWNLSHKFVERVSRLRLLNLTGLKRVSLGGFYLMVGILWDNSIVLE